MGHNVYVDINSMATILLKVLLVRGKRDICQRHSFFFFLVFSDCTLGSVALVLVNEWQSILAQGTYQKKKKTEGFNRMMPGKSHPIL